MQTMPESITKPKTMVKNEREENLFLMKKFEASILGKFTELKNKAEEEGKQAAEDRKLLA